MDLICITTMMKTELRSCPNHPSVLSDFVRSVELWIQNTAQWVVLCLALGSASLQAAVHYVNGGLETDPAPNGQSWATAWTTIADAMSAATEGDEIWVAQGVYKEFVVLKNGVALYGGFNGTETHRDQRNFTWNTTTIFGDGGTNTNNVVIIENATNTLTRLDGFNIEKNPLTVGSAIYTTNASPWIANNRIVGLKRFREGPISCYVGGPVISNNIIADNGYFTLLPVLDEINSDAGAIACRDADATIVHNLIVGNRATTVGGIYYFCGTPHIEGNTIAGNIGKWLTGGIDIWGASSAMVFNNKIIGNAVGDFHLAGSAAALSCIASTNTLIANNLIQGNVLGRYLTSTTILTAGLLLKQNVGGQVIHNTIVQNRGGVEGAIHSVSNQITVANNIVTFNSSGISGTADLSLFNNCVYGNGTNDYVNVPNMTGIQGNISADPMLSGDARFPGWHLLVDSPCRAQGNSTFVQTNWTDLDGEERLMDGLVDIGADAFHGTTPEFTPAICRVTTTGDDRNDGTTWEKSMRTVQAALDRAAVTGGEVWVAEGTYRECIIMRPMVYLYGGFAGTEANRSERDWKAHETILDGQNAGTVVTYACMCEWNTLDGFTIQNGAANRGGGIFGTYSSPIIANNKIINNSATNNYASAQCRGGGIYTEHCSLMLSNNIIKGNVSAAGGGVYTFYDDGDILLRNTFTDNTCVAGGSTLGGIWNGGGGLCAVSSSVKVINNVFFANYVKRPYSSVAKAYGGAIFIVHDGYHASEVRNNTFLLNYNETHLSSSGGMAIQRANNVVCANNLFAYNSNVLFTESVTNIQWLNNCTISANKFTYTGITNQTGLNGNISADPLFVQPPQPFLMSNSPCIDVGTSAMVDDGELDWAGNPRMAGAGVDIGAIEYTGTVPDLPRLIYHVSTNGSDAQDGFTWSAAKRTVQATVSAATITGGDIWVAQGTYAENVAMGPYVYLYGGFDGTETSLEQRDWAAHPTILDGGSKGCVVTIDNAGPYSTLSGFTITNGHGMGDSGGISCEDSSPIISFNRIVGNQSVSYSGGIECRNGSPIIYNNLIAFNTNGSIGNPSASGVCLDMCSNACVIHNTVISNRPSNGQFLSAAVLTTAGGTFINNLIACNQDAGIYFHKFAMGAKIPVLSNNCVYGHSLSNHLIVPIGVNDFTNNPMLVPGTFELSADSPCIDAGNDGAVRDTLDLLGQPRISGGHVDIGAFEYAAPGQWIPLVPDPSALSLTPMTVGGITYVAYGFEFAEAQCRLQTVAPALWEGSNATVDLPLEQWTGRDIQGTNRLGGTLVLGALKPGAYALAVKVSGTLLKTVQIDVPETSGSTLAWQPRQTGESLKLQVLGVSGVSYRLLASTNLIDWESVATNQGAPFAFDIPVETNRPACFYRVEVAP